MGYGDEIMASGLARGARDRGVRVAFGQEQYKKIRWHPYAHQIFRYNPNVAPPGSESDSDLEWIAHYAGKRLYCREFHGRWLFVPRQMRDSGELYLSDEELEYAEKIGSGFVLMEPNTPAFKAVAVNKQWPKSRYDEVAHRFTRKGVEVIQFQISPPHGPGHAMKGARVVKTPSFRHSMAVLARAAVYVGPEGGLHHGAAARKMDSRGALISESTPAVVIYGGFISPEITGYPTQRNFFTGGEPCGSLRRCEHCAVAMSRITVDQVYEAAVEAMRVREAA